MNPDFAVATATEIADRYARPDTAGLPADQPWWHQSLAHGALGVAVLHTELAAAGLRPFDRVHDWLTTIAGNPVTVGTSTGLFYGAPAVARVLAGAAAIRPGAYRSAVTPLVTRIATDAHGRVAAAHARMDAGVPAVMAEFDTMRGLAGVGAFMLHHDPDGAALRAVLSCLVRLAEPITLDGDTLSGWWTLTGPTGRVEDDFPGGHGNVGLAHGICGPLALLAQALRRGTAVAGQPDAIETICAWLDSWRIDTPTGHRWPYMITRNEHDSRPTGVTHSGAVRRPSWCYGTAGVARTLHLAALALGDTARRRDAEDALLSALTDPAQDALIGDASLCHGHAGLARIAAHAAADEPEATRLRDLATDLIARALTWPVTGTPGLLEGDAGIGLAALAAVTEPVTRWDTSLLTT